VNEQAHESGKKTIRVLVVDDRTTSREQLARWLRREPGLVVDTAGNSEKAVALVCESQGSYGAVVMDQDLGDRSGIETMKLLLSKYPDLQVIMYTGKEPEEGAQALREGAFCYLLKPFDSSDLVKAIRSADALREWKLRAAEARWPDELLDSLQQLSDLSSFQLPATAAGAKESAGERLVQIVHNVTGDDVALWMPDDSGPFWRIWAGVGLRQAHVQSARLYLENSITGEAIDKRESVEVTDIFDPLRQPRRFQHQEEALAVGWKSVLILPLLVRGHPIGSLSAYSRLHRRFAEWEKRFIAACVAQAAIAIDNGHLLSELKGRAEQLSRIQGITAAITAERTDLDRLLNSIAESRLTSSFAEASCVVRLYDSEADKFTPLKATGVMREMADHEPRPDGLSRHVVSNKTPLYIEDTMVAPAVGVPTILDEVVAKGVRSTAYLPLLRNGEVIGVLYVDLPTPHHFSESDKQTLELFADQIAIAVENAQLYEQRLGDIAAFQEINTAITSKPQEEICELITRKARELTQADYAGLWLVSANKLVSGSMHGTEPLSAPGLLIDKRSINGWVALAREPYVCYDVKTDPHYRVWREDIDIQTSAAVPLLIGDRLLGTLNIESERKHAFSEYQFGLLKSLADQAAIALENARLFRQTSELTDQIMRLQEVAAAIATGPSDRDEILSLLVHKVVEVMPGSSCAIRLYDPNIGQFRNWVAAGFLQNWQMSPRSRGTSQYIIKTRFPLYVEDTRIKSQKGQPSIRREFIRQGVRAAAHIPLLSRGNIIGAFYLDLAISHQFTQNEKQVLELFASQAAGAIDNSRLLMEATERATRLKELHQITAAISNETTDLDAVLLEITRCLSGLFGGAPCAIRLFDSEKGQFARRVAAGEFENWADHPPRPEGTSWHIIKTKKPYYISDVADTPSEGQPGIRPEFIEQLGVKAAAHLPLLSTEDKVIGLLYLDLLEPHRFSENDRLILELFASQAAIAIENAGLFQQLENRASQLERLQKATFAVSAGSLNLDEVLHQIVESLSEMFGGASCDMRLYDARKDEFGKRVVSQKMKDREDRLPRPSGSSYYVVHTKVARYLEDTSCPLEDGGPEWHPAILQEGAKALAHIPLLSGDEVVGILYVNMPTPHQFSTNERQMLEIFASQSAIAIEKARLYAELSQRAKQLAQRTTQLEILPTIYEEIIAAGIQNTDRIVDLLYKIACSVMNLSDAQVQFAFYDADNDQVTFPLAVEQDDGVLIDRVRWGVREHEFVNSGEDESVAAFQPRSRGSRFGLTEYVIHTKTPILIADNFWETANALRIHEQQVRVLPTFGRRAHPTYSWLGVPMVVQGQVIGIISIQSLEQERAFTHEQVDLLSIVANQAAVAIRNAQLYAEVVERTAAWLREQERADAAEKLALMSDVAAEFAHRMNNLAGTIPARVEVAKENLDQSNPKDKRVIKHLDSIASDAKLLLDAALEIKKSTESRAPEDVDVAAVLEIALGRVWSTKSGLEGCIQVHKNVAAGLPSIHVERNKLLDTLVSMIQNGIEAMPEGGDLTLSARLDSTAGRPCVEIVISDTGVGIPPADLPRIFDLFYTTKKKGLGFGLWRDRMFVKNLGGEIEVSSIVNKGTNLTVRIPLTSSTTTLEGGQNA
jgi:two-component system, NtrC family, sensor kinase